MHMNIITIHGRNARIGSNRVTVTQFQFRMTPAAIPAPKRKYSAKRYRAK
jgi:hypothetical protein